MAKRYRLTSRRMAALKKAQAASARKRRKGIAIKTAGAAFAVAGVAAAGYGGYKLNIRKRNRKAVAGFVERAKAPQLALPAGTGRKNIVFKHPRGIASRQNVTGTKSGTSRLLYGQQYKNPPLKAPAGIRGPRGISGRRRGASITNGRVTASGRLRLGNQPLRHGGFRTTRNAGDMSTVVVQSTTHDRVIKVDRRGKAIVTTENRIGYDALRRTQYRNVVGPKKPKKRRVRKKQATTQRRNNVVSMYAFKDKKKKKGK